MCGRAVGETGYGADTDSHMTSSFHLEEEDNIQEGKGHIHLEMMAWCVPQRRGGKQPVW